MHRKLRFFLIVSVFVSAEISASDWPQFLGPTRNGVYGGSDLVESWPSKAPPMIWQKEIGHGFSGPVVADHKLILFQRRIDQETVECLDARTGSPIWNFAYPTSYQDEFGFDDGPRATPSIAAGRVYTLAPKGCCIVWTWETEESSGASM